MIKTERLIAYLEESIAKEKKRKEETEGQTAIYSYHYGKEEAYSEIKALIEDCLFDADLS